MTPATDVADTMLRPSLAQADMPQASTAGITGAAILPQPRPTTLLR